MVNAKKVEQIATEGGGTRIFEGGVNYAVIDMETNTH